MAIQLLGSDGATLLNVDSSTGSVKVLPYVPAITQYNLISAATTNAASIKATLGKVYWLYAVNTGATAAVVKLYNKASAPTVGTDVPVVLLPLAAGASGYIDFSSLGYDFSVGIAISISGGILDADVAAVLAAQVKVSLKYNS